MIKKQQMTAALTAAAIGGTLLTGCGHDRHTAEHTPEHTAAVTATERKTDTTRKTEADTRKTETTAQDRDGDPFDYEEQPHATSGPDIIDRAESALDRAEDAVTGMISDATKEVHPFD